MLGCIQVLQDVLEERCSNGDGTAIVNIYDLISSLASVTKTPSGCYMITRN
jgi:hypothetical protein